jgi:hypothetical protein
MLEGDRRPVARVEPAKKTEVVNCPEPGSVEPSMKEGVEAWSPEPSDTDVRAPPSAGTAAFRMNSPTEVVERQEFKDARATPEPSSSQRDASHCH